MTTNKQTKAQRERHDYKQTDKGTERETPQWDTAD